MRYKSKSNATLLAIFFGGFGAHKFYLGEKTAGYLYLLFCWTCITPLLGVLEGLQLAMTSEAKFSAKYNPAPAEGEADAKSPAPQLSAGQQVATGVGSVLLVVGTIAAIAIGSLGAFVAVLAAACLTLPTTWGRVASILQQALPNERSQRAARIGGVFLFILVFVGFQVMAKVEANERQEEAKKQYALRSAESAANERAAAAAALLPAKKSIAEKNWEQALTQLAELPEGTERDALQKEASTALADAKAAATQEAYVGGLKLAQEGKLSEAITKLRSLGAYKDSEQRVKKLTVARNPVLIAASQKLIAAGKLEEAKAALEDCVDSSAAVELSQSIDVKIQSRNYDNAVAMFKNKQLAEARDAFDELDDYKDSKDWLAKAEKAIKGERAVMEAFIEAVESMEDPYDEAPNELKKSAIRTKRGQLIKKALSESRNFKDWWGTLVDMQTTGDGKAFIKIRPDGTSQIMIMTWNNELSDIGDRTLISQKSSLFSVLSELSEGDDVVFSGTFIRSDENDFVKEGSMTESGSMDEPEFIARFSSIKAR